MAIAIKPDDFKIQSRGESVTYDLPWDLWDADLAKAPREAKLATTVVRGTPISCTLLEDDRAKRTSKVLVRSSDAPGEYRITRVVIAKGDKRRRSFTVLVE
jgi:hypothetical protein